MIRFASAERAPRVQASVSVRSVFSPSILTILTALAVLPCTALISANAQSTQDDSASASPDLVASRTKQLEILKQNIHLLGLRQPPICDQCPLLPSAQRASHIARGVNRRIGG